MQRYQFELATPDDDEELRMILRQTPMPGRISICFQREPSFFDAAAVEGDVVQTVVCRDTERTRIVGFGTRSIRQRYVDGVATPVGYLSSLRVLPEYRSIGLVARGYAYFRELHEDGRTPFYLTTIAAGNEPAIKILTSGRAGLPSYQPQGDFYTMAFPIHARPRSRSHNGSLAVRVATARDVFSVIQFAREEGRKRQFSPCISAADLEAADGLLRGLGPDDFLIAERRGELVGTLAVWDQQAFRQNIVQRYNAALRYARPMVNAWSWLTGQSILPRPGDPFRCVSGAFCLIRNHNTTVFEELLAAARSQRTDRAAQFLLLGMHESDPLLTIARRAAAQEYLTHLYIVSFERNNAVGATVERPVHLELGTL